MSVFQIIFRIWADFRKISHCEGSYGDVPRKCRFGSNRTKVIDTIELPAYSYDCLVSGITMAAVNGKR